MIAGTLTHRASLSEWTDSELENEGRLTHPLAYDRERDTAFAFSHRSRDKSRLCNMHFYMPPESNGLDLMSNGETDRGLLDTLLTVLPEFGVYPFEARRECTGFIFNRIWAAIKRESLAVVAEGVARPEDVDGMFKVNLGVSAGPFQMMDLVGLDVVLDIENNYANEFSHLPKNVRDLLQEYVDAGKLGIKTGEGFYNYR